MIDAEYSALVINGWSKPAWPYTWTASGKHSLNRTLAGDPTSLAKMNHQDLLNKEAAMENMLQNRTVNL